MKYLLFTSSTCKACPAMKSNMKAAGIEYEELNVEHPIGNRLASRFYVKSLPTLVIMDGDCPIEIFKGVLPIQELKHIGGDLLMKNLRAVLSFIGAFFICLFFLFLLVAVIFFVVAIYGWEAA